MYLCKDMKKRFTPQKKSLLFANVLNNSYFWGMNQETPKQQMGQVSGKEGRKLIEAIDKVANDNTPWFAIRLFGGMKSADLADYFRENDVESFIPMQMVDFMDKTGHIRHALRPVVRNLIFVKKTVSNQRLNELMAETQKPMMVMRKTKGSKEYYEIPAKQMVEFRTMCDPQYAQKMFLTTEEAQLKVGDPVLVAHGPLKGVTGRLVRQNKKYYLLKEVPGMGVMVKVSRWCCKPIMA